MSRSELVLLTGVNGFVGFAILSGLLKVGYHVRAAVRRQDAVDTISRGPSMPGYIASGALTFTLVPDNTISDAYLTAAQNCIYIIHVASPLPTQPGDLVSQAVAGNKSILSAAEQTPSIKRVIFTGSTSSIRSFERLLLRHPSNQAIIAGGDAERQVETLTAETKAPTQPPIPDSAPGFHRYINSKLAATNLVHEYGACTSGNSNGSSKRRHFSIINIFPGWIFGPEGLARTKAEAFKGSNLVFGFLFFPLRLNPFFGLEHEEENAPLLAESVHIDDVVEGHVKALDTEKVPGEYKNFLLNSESPTGPVWADAEGIVRRELREEVEHGLIPFAGTLGSIKSKFDATPSERDLLGHPFKPFPEQVKDTIKWYVHLPDE